MNDGGSAVRKLFACLIGRVFESGSLQLSVSSSQTTARRGQTTACQREDEKAMVALV
jgi:hypothetical protein